MYWILYDIVNSKVRNKMVKICMDYGLRRIQKSCFFGEISKTNIKRIESEISGLIQEGDRICLIPMSQKDIKNIKTWGIKIMELQKSSEIIQFL